MHIPLLQPNRAMADHHFQSSYLQQQGSKSLWQCEFAEKDLRRSGSHYGPVSGQTRGGHLFGEKAGPSFHAYRMTWLEAFTLMWMSILEIMIEEDQQDHDNICDCAFLFYKPRWKFIHKFPYLFMEIFFHGDQTQNKHSSSCALSALITLNSNLEKIYKTFTLCVVWRRCANLCEGSSKKTWNQL